MRNLIVLVVCLISASSIFAQQKTNSKKLDIMIEDGLEDWQIPGLSAIVVKDGMVSETSIQKIPLIRIHCSQWRPRPKRL